MTTETQTENPNDLTKRKSSAETVVGFAVLGCLVAGAVGILKALSMDSGSGVFLCLSGSVAAFGMVCFIYFGKD